MPKCNCLLRMIRTLQSRNAFTMSLRFCYRYVENFCTVCRGHLFFLKSNVSHVFRMSQLTMMYLRYFLVFAWLTNLLINPMSSTAPAAARQKRIVNVLCDVCGKSFSNSWAYERHRTCTKLKGTSCYSQATQKVELLATRRGNMATAMLSRSLSQGHTGLMPKYAKYVLGPQNMKNMYMPHKFSIFCKNMKKTTNTRTGCCIPSGCSSYFAYFFAYF